VTHVLDDGGDLGKRARVHCRRRFDLERVAASWDALLRELSGRRARGAPARPCSDASAASTLTSAAVSRTAQIRAGPKEQ
jgi:hypothetical protein